MDACSSLFPLTDCEQASEASMLQERRRKRRTTSTQAPGAAGRVGEFATNSSTSKSRLCAEWMRIGRWRTNAERRRRKVKKRAPSNGADRKVCWHHWGSSTPERQTGGGNTRDLRAFAVSGPQHSTLGSCGDRELTSVQNPYSRQPAGHYSHSVQHLGAGHSTLHHVHTSSSMATNLFVVLVAITSLLVHRCTGVVVYGQYECRSTRPPTPSTQQRSDSSIRAGHMAAGTVATREPSRVPLPAAGGSVVYSKGEFTNARYNPFQSPRASDWPNHYFPNMECWYNFTAPHGHNVYVEFPTVRIEGDSRMCHWDRDLLTVPTQHTGDRLLCGSPTDYGATITGLQTVSVHFKSNDVIEAAGFSGYFFAYPINSPTMGHGRRKRALTESMMQRLRRWIANPYVRRMLREQLLARQEEEEEADAGMQTSDVEVVQELRRISLNGRTSVREHGCQDCRIARLFEACECAGIRCREGNSQAEASD